MINAEQAAKMYSEIVGRQVNAAQLKNERVNHPLGQMFWRRDEISDEDFEKYLAETIGRQVSAADLNAARLSAMSAKQAAKQEASGAAKEDSGSPMGW
jgi:hypothetical protein